MNRKQFEWQRQLMWVYLRHEGRCALCLEVVSPEDVTTDRAIPEIPDIDKLLLVRPVHWRCLAGARQVQYQAVA